ncbi:MAG: sulfatase [Pirellulales bacterium]|nr:sulfatase [Pirellulales bacterium]
MSFGALNAAVRAAEPPNVVLIIADDHGWRDYGFMGHPHVHTPHLDRLAAASLAFTRGYVPSSLCSPSLASIITGQYAHVHGITCNDPPMADGQGGAAPAKRDSLAFAAGREILNARMARAATIPRLLAGRGYESLQTGKWWQGDYTVGGFTHGMTHGELARGGRHGDEGLTIGRRSLQPIADFIASARDAKRPFFVWYAPMLPHQPHDAPEKYVEPYRAIAASETVARYWANITWFDETCGELLAMLDSGGLRDNTLVIYLADNGWIQDPQTNRSDPRSKQSPYDGGLRTPLLVRWPAQVKPRRDEHQVVTSLDVLPTVLAAAGGNVPDQLPGINLLDEAAVARRETIRGEVFLHTARTLADPAANLRYRWLVASGWKLIVPNAANEPAAKVELFDLARDPDERRNLADADPERANLLHAALNAWWPGR